MLEIEQAGRLIGALKEFAARDARESFEKSPADRYDPPSLCA